jgi:anti-anti-sigma regulatory factor
MIVRMLNLEMSSADGCAVISVSGSLTTAAEADTMSAALSFVPPDDHLIVDLRDLQRLSPRCAEVLSDRLSERVEWAETVVVSDRPEVTMQLLLTDLDRVVPMVRSVGQAVQVIGTRSGFDATQVA